MIIFTTEDKTSSIGLHREQYLPITAPWEGISNSSWVEKFLDVYVLAGLDISRKPLGLLLLFMLTGWKFDRDGKKAILFLNVCRALGVEFNFSHSNERVLEIYNTESRRQELIGQIYKALKWKMLCKQEALALHGRLGFADSFMYGRFGALVLKSLIEPVYGRDPKMDDDMCFAWHFMRERL